MNAFLDPKPLKAALNGRLHELARQVIGEPNRHLSSRRELRFGRNGSLSLVLAGPDAGAWFDHEAGEGGDLFALIMRETGLTFPGALDWASSFVGRDMTLPAYTLPLIDLRRSHENAAKAERIWSESADPRGTIVDAYLSSRGIAIPDHASIAAIRFHGALWRDEARVPGMVALIRDIRSNEPQAIHRTFLAPDATRLDKRMLGPAGGGAIKLDPDETVSIGLVIGEGIETCLSAAAMGFRPAWALGSAGAIANFPVLPGIDGLTIALEEDAANRRAVAACAERWQAAGRDVVGVRDRLGGDLNDAIRRAA